MNSHALPTLLVPAGTCIAVTEPPQVPEVRLESPALEVMTDFSAVRVVTIHPRESLAAAEQAMIAQGVRTLFVISKFPCIDGILASRDLNGEKPMRLIRERNVRRDDLVVSDVMRPLADTDAVEFELVAHTTVGSVVATFCRFGHPYLLVLESASSEHPARIRGLISQSQVERQLGRALNAVEVASTFADISRALA